ncbi:MAG: hypothetical protein H6727_12500 [Myxococcales bacterium]|nr:hypothetical protein [Myxococcales bacterium]
MQTRKEWWKPLLMVGIIMVLLSYAVPFLELPARDIGDLFAWSSRTWFMTYELKSYWASLAAGSYHPGMLKIGLFMLVWLGLFAPPALLALLALRHLQKYKTQPPKRHPIEVPQPIASLSLRIAWACMHIGFFLTFAAFLLGIANHHNNMFQTFWKVLRIFPPFPLFFFVWWYRQHLSRDPHTTLRDVSLLAGVWGYAPFFFAPLLSKPEASAWHYSLGPWMMSVGMFAICIAAWQAEQQARFSLSFEDDPVMPALQEPTPWVGFCEEMGLPSSYQASPMPRGLAIPSGFSAKRSATFIDPYRSSPSLHSPQPAASWPTFQRETK